MSGWNSKDLSFPTADPNTINVAATYLMLNSLLVLLKAN